MNTAEFWKSNYYRHPPLTAADVIYAEDKLGVKLPKKYVELLLIQNGGYTNGFVHPMTARTTWSINHVPLNDLFGIVSDPSIESPQNILNTGYWTQEWGLPAKQVALSGDSHWFITLDYRSCSEPSVAWIDVECGEDLRIAETFDTFFDGLISCAVFPFLPDEQ